MSSSDPVRHDPSVLLIPEDRAALDAIFEAGLDEPDRVYAVDSRASRVMRLFALLGATPITPSQRETLVQATLARVTLDRRRRVAAENLELTLIPDDEDALEALVSAEFELSRVPAGMRERAARHMALLGLLDTPVPRGDSSEVLITATLARLQANVDEHSDRMSVTRKTTPAEERGVIFSFVRSRELVSVAALLLIATALLTPLAQYFREYSRRTACASNMAAAGVAFGQYAASNRDSLPLASASRPGNMFWNVGKQRDQSNSANLFLLNVQHFATVDQLACAAQFSEECRELGDDAWDWKSIEQVSLSFQNMFARERPSWSSSNTMVVLADASPVIRRAVRGGRIYPFENSANHMRRGQNALTSDGSVAWLKTPVLANNDNIWLPRPIESIIAKMRKPNEADPLHGTESPSAADDAFVGP